MDLLVSNASKEEITENPDFETVSSNASMPSLKMVTKEDGKKRQRISENSPQGFIHNPNETLRNQLEVAKPKSFTETALATDVILLEIFNHLSATDLKNFRLVNQKWNATATSKLLINKSIQLIIPASYKILDRCFPSKVYDTYPSLFSIIQNSVKFPTQSVVLETRMPENDIRTVNILSVFADRFKAITFSGCLVSLCFLCKLLVDYAPNLESLVVNFHEGIKDDIKNDEDDSCDEENVFLLPVLPNLKTIYVGKQKWIHVTKCSLLRNFYRKLLKAAVNLQSIRTFDSVFLEEALQSKSEVIKELKYDPSDFPFLIDGNRSVVTFASSNLKLSRMEIKLSIINPSNRQVILSKLNAILESSKETLTELDTELIGEYTDIVIPELPNLTRLGVRQNYSAIKPLFPPTVAYSKQFPRLFTLSLHLSSFKYSALNTVFGLMWDEGDDVILSNTVKHLELGGNLFSAKRKVSQNQLKGAKMLAAMFPNVQFLRLLLDNLDTSRLDYSLWHLCPTELKSLHIFGLDCHGEKSVKIERNMDLLDSFFTGIPTEICSSLRNGQYTNDHTNSSLRTQKSICDISGLKELKLFCIADICADKDGVEEEDSEEFIGGDENEDSDEFSDGIENEDSFECDEYNPLFASHLTGMYGFGLMPQLKVTIVHCVTGSGWNKIFASEIEGKVAWCIKRFESCLKPIAPFIHSIHDCNNKYFDASGKRIIKCML